MPPAPVLNPDFVVVQPNTTSSGNVSTNDSNVPAGTTYGQPVPVAGNPSSCVPVMASNGSYTFSCTTPGDYNFNVPVCPSGVTVNCPTVPLKITVSNPLSPTTNSPIVNPDFASTQTGGQVTVKTLANDVSGNPAVPLNPASVSVVTAPKNGTAVVESTTGDIKYTPSPGFVGSDTLKYQVCDTANPPKCGTAQQIFTVLPTNAPNTTVAVDDYVVTRKDTPVSGSVKTNDSDPQGNTQTVTAGTTNVPGAGSLVMNPDGSYVFTPVAGFVGTVAIPYTTCDNGTPQACATATLYINIIPPVCPKPVLSVQNIVCNSTSGTGYTVTFSSNAPVTTNNGTVSGNTVTVASGNATLTSTTSCGEVTSMVVTAPSCPVPAQCTQVASLSVGNALCTGTGTYTVNFSAINGTVTSSEGTVSGNTVINIPVGTSAVLTLLPTSTACNAQSVTVTSPVSCVPPGCTDGSVGISYSTVCNNDGTYNISTTTSVAGTTVTPTSLTNLTGSTTLTVTKPGCTPQTVTVTAPLCVVCQPPILTIQSVTCSATIAGAYTITFSSNGTVTTNNGTIIGNTVNVSSGNATLTSTASCGLTSSILINAPTCTIPNLCTEVVSLSIGSAVCVGNGTYSVSFTASANGVVTSSVGLVSGNSVINIPAGTNVVITVTPTNSACTPVSTTVVSPANCVVPVCNGTGITFSTACNNDGTYNINYTVASQTTTVSFNGVTIIGNGSFTSISGSSTLIATAVGCTPQTVTVTAPLCVVCQPPVLTVQSVTCSATIAGAYTITFSSNGTVTTNNGTIIGNTVNVSSGNATLTSTASCGLTSSILINAPTCTIPNLCTEVVSLSIGSAVCVGNGTYSVSFTASANGVVTSSVGLVSGNSVINIPAGTNVVITVTPTNSACTPVSTTVVSPANCVVPVCNGTGITFSTACNNDGTYNINYTVASQTTTVSFNGVTIIGNGSFTSISGSSTLIATAVGCTPQSVTVNAPVCVTCQTPMLVSASPATICTGTSSTLSASCAVGTLTWYSDATLTMVVISPVSPMVTTTYYAACVTGTCKSVPSLVTLTVTNTPAAPTAVAASPSSICSGTSTTLTATCSTGTLTWFTDAGLTGTALTSNVVSPTVTTTYYAACLTGTCKSVASPVTVTVTGTPSTPTALAPSPSNICSGTSSTLTATCSNGTLTWYTDAGLTSIALTSNVVSPMVTTTYYAACVTGECKSVASPVTVTVSPTPIAPTAAAASPSNICSGTSTTLTATCSTGTLTWYTDASLTTISGTSVNPSSTKIYFATCKTNGCESKATEVTVIVSNCISSLKLVKNQTAISGQTVGSTIAYSLVVTNTGATTLTNVTVTDANATITGTNPIASLAPAASVTLTAVHTITQSDFNMGKVLNTANVSGTTPTGGSATDVSDTGTDPTGTTILNAESVDGPDMDTDPTNDPTETILIPIAVNDLLTAPAGTTSTVNVLSNDNFLPGVNTTLIGLPGGTATGTVIFDPLTGIMSYKPAVGESGIVTQRYKVCNTTPDPDQCAEAVVTITVADVVAKLIVKVLLQGALLPTSSSGGPIMNGIMRDDLRTASPSQIPNLEPYAGLANARFTHVGGGGETIGAGVLSASSNDAIVDWVFVELRDKNNPATVLKTRSALVQRDGDVVESSDGISPLTFTGAVGESYYVSVKHRNHLGAMTAGAVAMTATGTLVDFTTMTAAQTYNLPGYDGFEQVDVNGKMALWAGNSNADNKVKYVGVDNDQIPVFSQAVNYVTNTTQQYNFDFATPVYLGGDINMDAKVKYRGPNNDASFIFFNVITKYAGLNTGALYNYDLFIEQLP